MRKINPDILKMLKHRFDEQVHGCYTPIPMGAFYTVAKLPVDDAEKFCAWCLEEFRYKDETTETLKPSGTKGLPVIWETVMMAPAAGFYTNPELGKIKCDWHTCFARRTCRGR